MGSEFPKRKTIKLNRDCYQGGDNFLVTICTENRGVFEDSHRETVIRFLERDSADKNGCVYGWVVMLDHIHVLIAGTEDLVSWVAKFKSATVSSLKRKGILFAWQRSFHDRGIRPGENLESVAHYMLENPVRAELVRDYMSWPWSYMAGMKPFTDTQEQREGLALKQGLRSSPTIENDKIPEREQMKP
jgi:REP element-mobilizing transposase RayT